MTPAELTLVRALIRDVRAHFDGRGISGPLALRLADACEMLVRERGEILATAATMVDFVPESDLTSEMEDLLWTIYPAETNNGSESK